MVLPFVGADAGATQSLAYPVPTGSAVPTGYALVGPVGRKTAADQPPSGEWSEAEEVVQEAFTQAGGRAIPELWPLGAEALALAMEVSVLEARRLGYRAVLRLSWLLLVASVALSTLLQVAVAPPTLVGYLTAGATPVWLGSFAVLSLLYRTPTPALDPAADADDQELAASGEPSKRQRARAAYAALVAAGQPVTGARLAEAADISASYGRALLAEFQADPNLSAGLGNGQRPAEAVGES
jgi:hypothetical protein